jgi:hypothetical protein
MSEHQTTTIVLIVLPGSYSTFYPISRTWATFTTWSMRLLCAEWGTSIEKARNSRRRRRRRRRRKRSTSDIGSGINDVTPYNAG